LKFQRRNSNVPNQHGNGLGGDKGHVVEKLTFAGNVGGGRGAESRGGRLLDGGGGFGLLLLGREKAALVVVVEPGGELREVAGGDVGAGGGFASPNLLDGSAMRGQCALEGFDGREESLLERRENEGGLSLLAFRGGGESLPADRPIGIEPFGEAQLRGVN